MSSAVTGVPLFGGAHSLRRFTVDEYHRMIETDILNEMDRVELLEGYVVLKMPRNPPHDGTIQSVRKQLAHGLPSGWDVHIQSAITLSDSEPEPDLVVARGNERSYFTRHPGPADVGLVVEVADTSINRDRDDKGRIYARAGIPIYWIVNLVDVRLEVFTAPSGPTASPGYGQRVDYDPAASVPFVLDGVTVTVLAVRELLP